MPEQTFLPYAYVDGAIELRHEAITLDGNMLEVAQVVDPDARAVSLSGLEDWEEAALRVRVVDPNDEIPTVLLDEETVGDIDVMVVARGMESRFRRGVRLAADDEGWTGEITLPRAQLRGALDLEAIIIRARDGLEDEERAFRKGERVAASEAWRVYLDDRIPMPGGAIEGEWRDFATDPLSELRSRKDCTWYLDLRQNRPRIFLNERIEGFRATLEVAQNRGVAAHVRNALTQSVLQPILMAMAFEAIQSAPEPSIDELEGWCRKLLSHLARQCDGATEEALVEGWLQTWKAGDRSEVVVDLATAVQRHLEVGKGARNLISSLEARSHE